MRARLITPGHLALAMLVWSSCGYFGIELRDDPTQDGGGKEVPPDVDGTLSSDAASPLTVADGHVEPSDDSGLTLDLDGAVRADAQTPSNDASDDGGSVRDLDASAATDADAQSPSTDARVQPGPPCDFSGTWAARLDGTLSWSNGILQGGSGPLNLWFKYQSNANGSIVSSSLVTCGMAVPDFRLLSSLGNELYH
ncbi:MAG TPA: hypothetical protein VI299_12470, partial [Polyangiales bacterium]